MATNWQNKGRPGWMKDSEYIASRCIDTVYAINPWSWSHGCPQFPIVQPDQDIFIIWSAVGWLLGHFLPAASVTNSAQLFPVISEREMMPTMQARRFLELDRNTQQMCLWFSLRCKANRPWSSGRLYQKLHTVKNVAGLCFMTLIKQ